MINQLMVLIPTRGRPEAMQDIDYTFNRTTANAPPAYWRAVCDDDDPRLAEYPVDRIAGPHKSMNEALNWAAPSFAGAYAYIGFMGDDHRPRTEHWNVKILDALDALGTGIVYGNDLFQGPNLPTAVFMTSDIIRALGYMAPPCLDHLELDSFWLDLGRELNMISYLDDVIIEHMHPEAGKAEYDEGYARMNSKREHDRIAYAEYKASGEFASDVEKVRAIQVVR